MTLKWEIKKAKIALMYQKARKEALKLAFAVVITEAVIVGGVYLSVKWGIDQYFQPKTIIIELARPAEASTITPEAPKVSQPDTIADLANTIYNLESSNGKNNYSKCAAIGKVNYIGFGIYGNHYQCFDDHAAEMATLNKWIIAKQSAGMNDHDILCTYSGNNYASCK